MADKEIYRVEIPIIVDDQTDAPLRQAERKISKLEQHARKENERIRQHFMKIAKLQIEPIMRVRDHLTSGVLKADRLIRKLDMTQASPLIAAQDKVSAVVTRINAMLAALDKGQVDVVAEMQGPLLDEIVKAKSSLSELNKVKAGPVAELRGELFGQLSKAMSQIRGLDLSKAEPKATLRERVTWKVREVSSSLRNLTSRAWNVTLQVKDKVSGVLRGVTGGLRRVGGLLTSPLTLLGVGGGVGGLSKLGIDMVVERENITMAFETLLGSADAAAKRIEELTEFAGQTPFLRDEIYEASRILEVFTRGALSTSKGLKLVGDVAAGAGQDYKDVALWIGRLYDAMASGRPVGVMTARLQEMGAISGEQRAILEQLAKSGKDIAYTWPEAEKVFSRFEGQMERMSKGLGNMLTSVKSFFRETVLLRWGKGIEAELRPLLERFRQWRREHPEQVQAIGDKIERIARTGMRRIVDFVKKGYGMIADIISDESLTWSEKVTLALDKILESLTAWLKGPGGETIRETGEALGMFLAAGLEGAIPNIAPIAKELGKTLGGAVVQGIYEAIKANPWAGILLGSYIGFQIAGPKGAAIGAGIGAAAWGLPKGFEALGKHIPGSGYYIRERLAEYERAEQMFEELKAVTPPGEPLFPGTELRAMPKRAIGGIYYRPHTALVAEAGPEAIIPLTKPTRAWNLWQKVGDQMGFFERQKIAYTTPTKLAHQRMRLTVPEAALDKPASALTRSISEPLEKLETETKRIITRGKETISRAVMVIAQLKNNMLIGGGFAGATGPAAYIPMVTAAAAKFGIPAGLLSRLIQAESNWRSDAVSPVGAFGLTQVMPGTARGMGYSVEELRRSPALQIEAGARYLSQQYQRFKSWPLALAAYNAGPGAVSKYGGIPPYRETQNYVAKILSPKAYAKGGILSRPEVALVGENGPEAVIPLSERMRGRALRLYEETGRRLGVRPYAEGGFAGALTQNREQKIPVSFAPSLAALGPATLGPATINLNFDLTGLVRQVVIENREDIDGAVDKITDAIANNLRSVFQNMTK